jgi:hypothetical protein
MAAREGLPIPKGMSAAPELWPGLSLYFSAYVDLRTCAADGGPVPWTATDQWATSNDLDGDQRRALHHHVRAMDGAFLDHVAKERKSRDAKAIRGRNGSPRKAHRR